MKKTTTNVPEDYKIWIKDKPLEVVIIRIHTIFLQNPGLLNGEILGLLAKRLIENEIQPGGPYLDKKDFYLNTLIMRLFHALGYPLENLDRFMDGITYTPKNSLQKLALELPLKSTKSSSPPKDMTMNEIILQTNNDLKKINTEIHKRGLLFLNKIVSLDINEEISLISFYTLKSIKKSYATLEIKQCNQLGMANVYAWMAYTIYDDFIDDQGNNTLLSLANIVQRKSFEIYNRNFPLLKNVIQDHFDSVDVSNLWELLNCRAEIKDNYITLVGLPEYGDGIFLAERSIGHILGSKLIIKKLNLSSDKENLIFTGLEQYLIAKQIYDDLSDWESDLRNGHLSYVVTKLLRSNHTIIGNYEIDVLVEKLKPLLWNTVFKECSEIASHNLDICMENLKKSEIFIENNDFNKNIIQPLRLNIDASILQNTYEKQFLKTYIS